jgi:prepilin-type N-terminal cleavage/methylation domain-containing protein
MMTRKLVNSQDGFTLVESVMAVVILGMALGACILSFAMGMRIVYTAGNQQIAMHGARAELETLRLYSLTNASTLTAGTHVFTNGTTVGTYVITNLDTWTRNVTVNVPYVNDIHHGTTTNTLTTTLTSTLHP